MRKLAIFMGLLTASVAANAQQGSIPPGTRIPVRTNQTIDVRDRSDGRIFTGVVAEDVLDNNGNLAIPRGSQAELIVRSYSSREMALDLESVLVNGRRYMMSTSDIDRRSRQGVGGNSRTAKYVGGGALLGTIIGAIAGGGKGAAIGALGGAAAGAGTQVLTRGNAVRVPAESMLTFRLDRPVVVNEAWSGDHGYQRDGNHYHYDQNNDPYHERYDRRDQQQQYRDQRQYR